MIYISIILIVISLVLFILTWKIKLNKKIQQQKINQEIQKKQQEKNTLNTALSKLHNELSDIQNTIINLQKEKNQLQQNLEHAIQNKQIELKNKYQQIETTAQQAYNNYISVLDQYYTNKENEVTTKVNMIQEQRASAQAQLNQIQQAVEAASAARLVEQEENNKWLFYSLDLTNEQLNDILELTQFKNRLNDPSLIGKIIWSAFVLRATNNLCNRVLGTDKKCGIYKITNRETKEVYIGQSLAIADRWKAHIKCGLGIDAPVTNRLYQKMQQYGVWTFTFELLEQCSKDKLNEREKFWIDFYQSDKIGLNSKGGNK